MECRIYSQSCPNRFYISDSHLIKIEEESRLSVKQLEMALTEIERNPVRIGYVVLGILSLIGGLRAITTAQGNLGIFLLGILIIGIGMSYFVFFYQEQEAYQSKIKRVCFEFSQKLSPFYSARLVINWCTFNPKESLYISIKLVNFRVNNNVLINENGNFRILAPVPAREANTSNFHEVLSAPLIEKHENAKNKDLEGFF